MTRDVSAKQKGLKSSRIEQSREAKVMTECRACKRHQLYLFLPLGSHPPANGFLKKEALSEPEATYPLNAYVCLDCGLIQIPDYVPNDFFRNYVYVPSASEVMHLHFSELAHLVAEKYLDHPDSLTIDIGCNDGLFLSFLKHRGYRALGVDPATNIVNMAREKGLDIVNEYFDPAIAGEIKARYGSASVIITTNTFHHIDDLDAFTQGVSILLDEQGVFIIEVPHALKIVEQNQFDGIYHEHVSQFTLKSLSDHCGRFNLQVFRVDQLDVHGGSIRVFISRNSERKPISSIVSELLAREAESGLFSATTYTAFRERVERIKENLSNLLWDFKGEGHRMVGYGASARGNTLLNYFSIGTDLLDYLVDRNSLKHGLYSPGMHIPVYPVEKIIADKPDYVLLLAWNFAEEIISQQERYVESGGKFILPIPEPRIVN